MLEKWRISLDKGGYDGGVVMVLIEKETPQVLSL